MKQTPPGWPRLSVAVFYDDPSKAIDWLVRAFGFEVRMKVLGDDGSVVHSELVYGEAVVMVASAGGNKAHPAAGKRDTSHQKSPRALGGDYTQSLMLYVDDVEAHAARAVQAGAKVVTALETSDYGPDHWSDRGYQAEDLEGHRWWFAQRLRSAKGA